MQIKKIWTLALGLLLAGSAGSMSAAEMKLKNGADLIIVQDARSPRDSVTLGFLGGNGLIKPKEQGVGQVLTGILNEGPVGLSSTEFRKKLFLLGGVIGFNVSSRSASLNITAPSDKLGEVLDLALQTLKTPKFDADTYQLARSQVDAGLSQREDDMSSTLRYFANRDAFDYHPDILDGQPSRVSLKNVNLKSTQAALPVLFDKSYLLAAAVGPTDPAKLQSLIEERLGAAGFLDAPVKKREFKTARKDQKPNRPYKVVLLDRPGATDNQLRYIVRRNIPIDNQDQVALELAAKLLGGGMQGSLFKVLRAERGLTYSAGAGVNEEVGSWIIGSFASTDKLAKLMAGIDEVVTAQSKVVVDKGTADLLKGDLLTQWKEGRELPSDHLSEVYSAKIYGRDVKFMETLDQTIAATPETEVTRLGKDYFTLKDAYIYVMGDKAKVLPVLKTLGYKAKDVKVVNPATIL